MCPTLTERRGAGEWAAAAALTEATMALALLLDALWQAHAGLLAATGCTGRQLCVGVALALLLLIVARLAWAQLQAALIPLVKVSTTDGEGQGADGEAPLPGCRMQACVPPSALLPPCS